MTESAIAGLADLPPGPALSAFLYRLDPDRLTAAQAIPVLRAWSRQRAHDHARMARTLARVAALTRQASGPVLGEWAGSEIAAALTWSDSTAGRELDFAEALVALPQVLVAFEQGRIDHGKAWVFTDVLSTTDLTPEQVEAVCAIFVPVAPKLTAGQLRHRLVRAVLAVDPEWAGRRYRRAVLGRRVCGYLAADGTATISGSGLPTDQAAAACARVDALAEQLQRVGCAGTVSQIRADVFLRLLDGRLTGLSTPEIIAALLADAAATADSATTGPATTGPATADSGSAAGPASATEAEPASGFSSAASNATADANSTADPIRTLGPDTAREPDMSNKLDLTDDAAHNAGFADEPDLTDNRDLTDDADLADDADFGDGPELTDDAGDNPDPTDEADLADNPGLTDNLGLGLTNRLDLSEDPAAAKGANCAGHPDAAPANAGRPVDAASPDAVVPGHARGPADAVAPEHARGGAEPDRPRGSVGGRPGTGPGRAEVAAGIEIGVGLLTLLRLDQRPGEIPGWGPVMPEVARAVVARQRRARWRFAILDDAGYLLLAGTTRHRPRPTQPDRTARPESIGSDRSDTGQADVAEADVVQGGAVELHVTAADLRHLAADPHLCPEWTPVIADLARRFADRHRLLAALDAHPDARLVRGALLRHVQIRDRACVAPGCRRPARTCDLDHTVAHATGGPSTTANVGPLCARHHALKHLGGWRLEQPTPGWFRWTSPLGERYDTRGEPIQPPLPEPWLRPPGLEAAPTVGSREVEGPTFDPTPKTPPRPPPPPPLRPKWRSSRSRLEDPENPPPF